MCTSRSQPRLLTATVCIALLVVAKVQAAHQERNPLHIPGRLQWTNAGGYCGETSCQMLALTNGAWVSQGAWRAAGRGPTSARGQLLVSVNLERALTAMKLKWTSWDSTAAARSLERSGQPQYIAFMEWVKGNLMKSVPVIMGEYVTDAADDPDYDHIVPVVGSTAVPAPANNYLTYYNLYALKPLVKKFSTLGATRAGCRRDLLAGGCVPKRYDYGTAVTGILDADGTSLPVRLTVDRASEPNYSPVDRSDPDEHRTAPAKPVLMKGKVEVSSLAKGQAYRLLRYDTAANVPTSGTAAAFLRSKYTKFADFVATGATWTYDDSFTSNGTIFYRCVQRTG